MNCKQILRSSIAAFLVLTAGHSFAQRSFSAGTAQNIAAAIESGGAVVGKNDNNTPDAQLAMSRSDYPVTAGDIYTLAFAAGTTPVSYSIPVDSSYRIRIANLGVINAKGLTYLQLKNQVTTVVQKNYPMGGVQFVLTAPATFTVTISGEVTSTAEKNAWALTRLSSFISESFTEYSSSRQITVVSEDGKSNSYDLFKASRDGDLSQDPYLRPGDKIVVNRADRKVSVTGQVERPGTYELLRGENLKALIGTYGGGLTKFADTDKIVLNRDINSKNRQGDTVYLDQSSIDADYQLEDHDILRVPSRTEILRTMFFEGAVGDIGKEAQIAVSGANADSVKTENNDALDKDNASIEAEAFSASSDTSTTAPVINRIPVSFLEGENLATLVRRMRDNFTATSDLRNAYIERGDQKIPLNLEKILYNSDFMSEYYAQADDTLYVPYMQNIQTILVTGEVKDVAEVNAWPQKRLSTVISPYLTDYSSTRNIEVISIDGVTSTYDLFRATRFGEIDQNPFLKAGETVRIHQIDRRVTLTGAVKRPGTYELLRGENLKTLIDIYGDGLAPLGDITRIELLRTVTGLQNSGEKIYLDEQSYNDDYGLACYDTVDVSSYEDLMPVIFVEGAVQISEEGTSLTASNRLALAFNNGEDYAFFARRNKNIFANTADLENAYIIRGDEHIQVNLSQMLYDETYNSKITMELNDTLLVPFRQSFVSVSGAVYSPGRYPYIPDRTFDYYIGLAGGFVKEKNKLDAVTITDIEGKTHKKSEFILPEMTIEAKTNSGLYFFNQYAPVLTTILSVISTTISILAVTNVL